ncbi:MULTISPECIES: hypothetical protein [unclassified Paenibacillus]|uniref:hypothetical protein n=1 Tax=unclassified Paenibacillus TaxID=185978 RepID=UPI00240767FF|nr:MULTISPECIES: hypothetical protein [unclassified Paenibacillus]MDF9841876.1 hypothetical protein [Paenibacillus sp. PastF-2]MDF9848443.1 hypothetical protein [Paenibacillus sp. PastM-2]MDF9855036.1 hypothetical protein [Paenibacillus sp. PastF-1]MDH6480305.1 hypothetical protein [Paenibacillus sp. PastH-2]MDH6507711.1 hypothetical protein [Paenibacillus sp. PastM-3]
MGNANSLPVITGRAAAEYLQDWLHISAIVKVVSDDRKHLYFRGKDQIGRRMEYRVETVAEADYHNIYERTSNSEQPEEWEWADAISVRRKG